MFQRFKSAIDRTIAEEQARQQTASQTRTASPSGSRPRSVSRTNSAKDSPVKRKVKKPSQDVSNGDNIPNPDPAVFEAAFALDEEEAEAKATAEQPAESEKDGGDKPAAEDDAQSKEKTGEEAPASDDKAAKEDSPSAPVELSPEVKTKLRKLEKLEKTYPGMLRSSLVTHIISRKTTVLTCPCKQSCYVLTASPMDAPLPLSPSRGLCARTHPSPRSKIPLHSLSTSINLI